MDLTFNWRLEEDDSVTITGIAYLADIEYTQHFEEYCRIIIPRTFNNHETHKIESLSWTEKDEEETRPLCFMVPDCITEICDNAFKDYDQFEVAHIFLTHRTPDFDDPSYWLTDRWETTCDIGINNIPITLCYFNEPYGDINEPGNYSLNFPEGTTRVGTFESNPCSTVNIPDTCISFCEEGDGMPDLYNIEGFNINSDSIYLISDIYNGWVDALINKNTQTLKCCIVYDDNDTWDYSFYYYIYNEETEEEEEFYCKSFDKNAFCNPYELTVVYFPAEMEYIPSGNIFKNCNYLKYIEVDPGNPKYDSRHYNQLDSVDFHNAIIDKTTHALIIGFPIDGIFDMAQDEINDVLYIAEQIFEKDSKLTNLVIKGPKNISEEMCYEAENLEYVYIGNTVESIDKGAFYGGCNSLTTIEYEENSRLKIIKNGAFAMCPLEEIFIPKSVVTIEDIAFAISPVTSTKIDLIFEENSQLAAIGQATFQNHKLNNFILPTTIKTILSQAFANTYITSITIPSSITEIGNRAFCSSNHIVSEIILMPRNHKLKFSGVCPFCYNKITAQEKIIQIGTIDDWLQIDFAFSNSNPFYYMAQNENYGLYLASTLEGKDSAELVTEIDVYTSKNIPAYSFYEYQPLTSVTLHNNINLIDIYAFSHCYNINSFNILKEVEIAERHTVEQFQEETYNIENNVRYLSNPRNEHYIAARAVDGNWIIHPDTELIAGNFAFNRNGPETLIIPNKVKSIGSDAFDNCTSLSVVYLPASLKYLSNRAFLGCTGLTLINVQDLKTYIENGIDGTPVEEEIDGRLNEGFTLYYKGQPLTEVTLPNNIYKIGDNALRNNQTLTKLTIPSSVTSIGENALANCPEVTDIYYLGSSYQWNQIPKGANWEPNSTYTLHFVPGRVWQYSL